jgi:FixJ family two-component response regulator
VPKKIGREPESSEGALVVIVDDDAAVARSTRRLVRSFGFDAEAYVSAAAFLESGYVARTACLILDVRMPTMDGLELQRRLAGREPRIPIVFITGRASEEEELTARRAGAVAFLRKPVGREVLLDVLRRVLARTQPT